MHLEVDAYDMPGRYGIGVLAIRSPVESANVHELERALDAMLESHSRLIVDLAATSYVCSVGWSALMVRATADRSRIRVVAMSPAVHDVFDLLGLSAMLATSTTVGEAVAAMIAEAASAGSYVGPADHAT